MFLSQCSLRHAVKLRCFFLILLAFLSFVDSALPPGHEDELYCPEDRCLQPKKDVPPGFTGPRTSFFECVFYKPGDEGKPVSPTGWGHLVGEEVKNSLKDRGYHVTTCAETAAAAGTKDLEPDSEDEYAEEFRSQQGDDDDEDETAKALRNEQDRREADRLEDEREREERERYLREAHQKQIARLKEVNKCERSDKTRPTVHAAFYLWYGNPEVDGRWIHWDHKVLPHWDKEEDAKHEKFNWRPPEEPHSTFYPVRGTYSSRDNQTLHEQFAELADAGVDSAMCSWWGRKDWVGKRDDADSGANTDELIPTVLEAAKAAGVGVSFHIEPYGGRTPETFLDDLKYIHETYGGHAGVHREGPKNLPVFWLYDVSSQHSKPDVARWRKALDSVRGTEFDGIFLCLWIGGHHNNDLAFVEEGGFDGAYTYFAAEGFTPGSNPKSWADSVRIMKEKGKIFIPAVGPGYDDTRVRPWNAHNRRERKYGEYYDRMWKKAIESDSFAISITSYNEWGEGTQIEPAKVYTSPKGERYLDYGRSNEPDYYMKKTLGWSISYKETACPAKTEL
eukprot:TRINITY_DN39484_c0_g1_i1.p1 TRINITY_DN39484_c0_g1~~TRINITY_DN39484_c0_g1_i1.p1  ORF type:complete len:562 (-),score=104.22 TRINITY_DN39484_c0_g1_i1:167-1852(-)